MMRQVSCPVRRGAGRKGRKDLARSLPSFHVTLLLSLCRIFYAPGPATTAYARHNFRHWGLANSIRPDYGKRRSAGLAPR